MAKFCFDDEKLEQVMSIAISLFVEYQTTHELGEEMARKQAIEETVMAVQAELDMVERGDMKAEETELVVVGS